MEKGRLANTGERELNDVRVEDVFLITSREYHFTFYPKCDYWRIGARFTHDSRGTHMPISGRYNDGDVAHLEICAGEAPDKKWRYPNLLQLQQYHFSNLRPTLHGKDNYVPRSPVTLVMRSIDDTMMEVTYSNECFGSFTEKIDRRFLRHFQVYAWADNLDFEVEYTWSRSFRPVTIEISNTKAIAGDPLRLDAEDLTILYGKNNAGKTSILFGASKTFMSNHDQTADYLAIDRYVSDYDYAKASELEASPEASKTQQKRRYNRCQGHPQESGANDWAVEMALVPDDVRESITNFFSRYFENWSFEKKPRTRYSEVVEARVNTHSVADQGTGALSALPIIIQLFNPEVQFLAIDEPELGLEPKMQKVISRAIKCASEGSEGFPKKRILLATHSHLFLDRKTPVNNYKAEKMDGKVILQRLSDIEEIREASYTLMGCDPTDLFFPANIIMVEGKSEELFLGALYRRLMELGMVRGYNIVFHNLGGYDKAPVGIESVVQALKTHSHTPIYKERICGIFDFPDQKKAHILQSIEKYIGTGAEDRFVHLPKNGIEYYYPLSFASSWIGRPVTEAEREAEVDAYLSTPKGQVPQMFGESITKGKLAEEVASYVLTMNNVHEIDPTIISLIVKADDLAFKPIE
jgi:hypothetical protein